MNALRWWNNIASYQSEFGSLPAGSAAAPAAEEEDDDDVDLFGSDDEEEDAEAERIKVLFNPNPWKEFLNFWIRPPDL